MFFTTCVGLCVSVNLFITTVNPQFLPDAFINKPLPIQGSFPYVYQITFNVYRRLTNRDVMSYDIAGNEFYKCD